MLGVLSGITHNHDSYFTQKSSLGACAQLQSHDALLIVGESEHGGLSWADHSFRQVMWEQS